MRKALPLFLVLALVGCKGSREKDVVGSWSDASQRITIEEAKTFKATMGPMSVDGTWTFEGNDITMTPKTLNGKSIAEIKPQLQKSLSSVPAAQRAQAKGFIDSIDLPNIYTLSEDGKTLTTNKEKDKNPGPGATLTKG
jgi:hypothetical protein